MKHALIKLAITIGFLLGLLTIPVKAADKGLAIGVLSNSSTFDTSGTYTEGSCCNDQSITTHSNDVDFGSIFAEFTMRSDEGNGGWNIGIEYIPGDSSLGAKSRSETDTDAGGDNSATYTAKAEISDHYTVYVEPVFYPASFLGVYLKGGVSRVTVNSLESLDNGIDSSAYGNSDVYGGMYGVGLRFETPIGVIFKTEYSKTQYGTVKMTSESGNGGSISADPEQESIRLGIGYQF